MAEPTEDEDSLGEAWSMVWDARNRADLQFHLGNYPKAAFESHEAILNALLTILSEMKDMKAQLASIGEKLDAQGT